MTLEKEEMTDEEIEKFDGFVEELEANDIELDKIRTYLLEQADTLDEDKDEAKRLMDEVDKDPVDDETCIGYFFSNSLLDFYRGITGIDDLFKPLGLKYTDGYLALIKKIVEDDDIYFLTKEGCMAEDDLPRIM